MPPATGAMDFGPDHQPRAVHAGPDRPIQRLPETRPARAAVELRRRGKEIARASGACEGAGPVFVVEGAAIGPLGRLPAQDPVLGRRQAPPPFIIALLSRERAFDGRRPPGQPGDYRNHTAGSGEYYEELPPALTHGSIVTPDR